ncbi:MAG TPA: SRPBCC domain-containing protein [Polyangiaceae bacterium]|nr:SRPBCC domain-containing protein [Polyangiaceae bacterium]
MSKQDFTTTFSVDQAPEEVFAAINDVRSWWSGGIDGRTDVLGAAFTYSHKDIHRTTHQITELEPGKRVVWRVTASNLSAFANTHEWDGTDIVFDISKNGDKTDVQFTHVGLAPVIECYDRCSRAWSFFITDSLKKRITTKKSEPSATSQPECRGDR